MKFSLELAKDSSFAAREFLAGKNTVTLARDILALDQDAVSAVLLSESVSMLILL